MSQQHWHGHSGDLGDIIFSLPSIKAMAKERGAATLYLFTYHGRTTQHMTPERFHFISTLLLRQSYIRDVILDGDKSHDSPLNGFRDHHKIANLADKHLATQGLPHWHRNSRWLDVPSIHFADVVFCRSKRYQNPDFPWKRAVERYGRRAVFIGLHEEYNEFTKEFGDVEFFKVSDAFELARVIAGSKLFIGNQSLPHAIAEGLKHPTILECNPPPHYQNCIFHRMNKIHGYGKEIEWPEI